MGVMCHSMLELQYSMGLWGLYVIQMCCVVTQGKNGAVKGLKVDVQQTLCKITVWQIVVPVKTIHQS